MKKYGRVKELRTVALYNLLSGKPFKDMDKGLTLMRKGAVSPLEIVMDWKKEERIARIFERGGTIRRRRIVHESKLLPRMLARRYRPIV